MENQMESTVVMQLENSRIDQFVNILTDEIDSPVLARLIEEIKNQSESTVHNYDRVHNRHNR